MGVEVGSDRLNDDMQFMAQQILFSPDEVAQITGLTKRKIWQLARDGVLPHHRIGQQIRVSQQQIDQLLGSTLVEARDQLLPSSRTR